MAELPKRALGRTGLQVTMLGYGAMELRGAPRGRDVTDKQAETILHAVLDAGINYLDTSIDYGMSEERIGRYICDRRAEYYLASKCGCLVGAPPAPRGQTSPHVFTRDNILAGVEQSLARMKTDYLDVLQFHISPSRKALEEHGALEAVLELKRTGAVRFVGMSGTLPNLPHQIAMGVFDVFQIPYSAVEREHETLITAAAKAGAGIVVALGNLLVEVARIGHQRRREGRRQAVQAHRGLHGERRAVADHLRHLLAGGDQLLARYYLVDDGLAIAFVGGEPAVAQREIGRRRARQRGIEIVGRAQSSDPGVRVADPGGVRHDAELALQGEREPDADREAIDRGDQRLFQIGVARLAAAAPVKQRIVGILVRGSLALGLVRREELDVAAGAKRLAGAGDDADIDVRIEADVAPAGA